MENKNVLNNKRIINPFSKKIIFYVLYLVIIGLLCFAIVSSFNRFYYTFFYVDGHSMEPTLSEHEFGIVDTHPDIKKYIERYDIVVTYFPTDYAEDDSLKTNASLKIKRVIALPGERIKIINDHNENKIMVEGKILDLPFVPNDTLGLNQYVNEDNEDILKLTNDEYFLMGDNWGHSSDSCAVGPIDAYMIQGILIAIEGVCEVKNNEVTSLTYTKTEYFK